MSDASQFGKGAIKTPKEIRDRHFILGVTPSSIDWSVPHKVPLTTPVFNQDGSSSCTAHATISYCMALQEIEGHPKEEYSRRYNYSQSFISPDGGAYIWKAMSVALQGLASEQSVPDGGSTEAEERDTTLNGQAILEARADKYAMIPRSNIDQMAQIIKDQHGFITGFNGHDGMFALDGTVIDWSKSDWGHCVYVYGFEIRNGKKCLRFRNSWTSNWGSNGDGFFTEDFVNSGMMFDCYVYADVQDIQQQMTEKDVKSLQVLEGYQDSAGVQYWTGKNLPDYLKARLADKVNQIQQVESVASTNSATVSNPVVSSMNLLTLGEAGSLLLGAGLAKLDSLNLGLILIGVGAALKIAVAILQKFNIPVSAN